MDELMKIITGSLLMPLVIAIATSYLTVRLSLRQFYSQKWWERKADTYSNILSHLSTLKYYFGQLLEDEIQGGLDSESPRHERLNSDFAQAREALFKEAGLGGYVVSENVSKAIYRLHSTLADIEERSRDYYEMLADSSNEVSTCIETVVQHSTTDLNVQQHNRLGIWPRLSAGLKNRPKAPFQVKNPPTDLVA